MHTHSNSRRAAASAQFGRPCFSKAPVIKSLGHLTPRVTHFRIFVSFSYSPPILLLYKIPEQMSFYHLFIISPANPGSAGPLCLLLVGFLDSSSARVQHSVGSLTYLQYLFTFHLPVYLHVLCLSVHLFIPVSVISIEALSDCTDVGLTIHPDLSEDPFPLF